MHIGNFCLPTISAMNDDDAAGLPDSHSIKI